MSVIGKAKTLGIGIGVVCLLVAGGFVGSSAMKYEQGKADDPEP